MPRTQLITGIAIAAALVVIIFFFIFVNPIGMALNPEQATQQATTTPAAGTGLVVQDETVGTGATAQVGDVITANYTGKLENGTVFDTSIGKSPIQFTLGVGQVIPEWDQGLQGMKVGGKRLLIIPPSLAYGAAGAGPIPPNSTLIFEVELLGVQAPSTTPSTPSGSSAN